MAKLYNKYRDRGFTILAVNAGNENPRIVRQFARKHDLPYPILLNGRRVRGDWGVNRIPANFYIDRKGKLQEKSFGFAVEHVPHMEQTIERLLE